MGVSYRLGFVAIAACHGVADGLYRKQLVGKGAFGVNIILFEESEVDTPFKREDPRVVHLLEVLRRKLGDATDVGLVNGPRGKAVLRSVDEKQVELDFSWGEKPEGLSLIHI